MIQKQYSRFTVFRPADPPAHLKPSYKLCKYRRFQFTSKETEELFGGHPVVSRLYLDVRPICFT